MNFKVWPEFIKVITRFWDGERIVFLFRNVKIMLTLKEIKDCLDSLKMCGKRKHHLDHHILLLNKPTSLKLKDMLLLVNKNWLETRNIPFMKFFERSGHDSYFRYFLEEFFDHITWR